MDVKVAAQNASVGTSRLLRLSFQVTNPGARTIHVRNARWFLYSLSRTPGGGKSAFEGRLSSLLQKSGPHVELASQLGRGSLVAAGSVFDGSSFSPGLSQQDSVLIKIPAGVNEVNLDLYLPHSFKPLSRASVPLVRYTLNRDGQVRPVLCDSDGVSQAAQFSNKSPLAGCLVYGSTQFTDVLQKSGLYMLQVDENLSPFSG